MDMYILDKQNQRRYGIKLWEVFPKTIGPQSLAYDANDALLLVPVNFSFRYWTSLEQSQNPPVSIGDRILDTVINSAERNITRNISKNNNNGSQHLAKQTKKRNGWNNGTFCVHNPATLEAHCIFC